MAVEAFPEEERHGKLWHQGPLRLLGNLQCFSIPIGSIGPGLGLGLSLGWTILAGALGILTGTVFMAFHAAQGPTLGLPQMPVARAVRPPRRPAGRSRRATPAAQQPRREPRILLDPRPHPDPRRTVR